MNTLFTQDPIVMKIKSASKVKLFLSKAFALALHISVLFAGTNLAEYGWRFWGGHY